MEVKEGYKQTEVGVIPEEWVVKRVNDVCTLINGRGFKPHEWEKDGLPIIRIQNLNGGEEFNYFQGTYNPKILIKNGDLLFAWSGSKGTSFGPHIWKGPNGLLNYHTWKINLHRFGIDKAFFLHYLNIITSLIENKAHGASALVHTQKGEMEMFTIPLPPLPEQQAIAEVLSDVDELIQKLDALIVKKRNIKQGAMQELLTGKRRLPGFEGKKEYKQTEVGEIPIDWGIKKIGDFTDAKAGGTPSTLNNNYWGGNIKWMSSGELHQKRVYDVKGRITKEGLKNSSTQIFPMNCILIGLAGQGKTRGTVAQNMVELCTNQSIAAVFPNEVFSSEYLFHNLDSRYKELRSLSTGSSGRGGLNLRIIKNIKTPFPLLFEQNAIAQALNDMAIEIEQLEQQRDKTKALKQGFMQELLTGKTRLI